jgi:glutathione synthase/RimK-type ligase-like ATP-grasp enzyme
VERGGAGALAALLEDAGWRDVVIKPTVSASAHETWLVRGTPTDEDEARYRRLVDDRAVLVQRFIPQVVGEGEWSFVFVDGAFSHAVLKRPADGDFRVQREHGGSAEARTPTPTLLEDARAVLARLPHATLYARVDGCALAGRLLLMELELIEPSLFLALDDRAAGRLAEAIVRRVSS